MSMNQIKSHFEEEANKYDVIIQNLIPNYNEMINALVSVIPFKKDYKVSMLDLGCGTGTVSKAVIDSFPLFDVTCVDIAENMLEIAKHKIGGNMRCMQADFNTFKFNQKYDLIISSLALHHLESDDDKQNFYKKIYSALNSNGVFINIDVVLGCNDDVQKVYMKKWIEFMEQNVSADEVGNKWLPNYCAEDKPTKTTTHLEMLNNCGFSDIDVIFKYYNYAVLYAQK